MKSTKCAAPIAQNFIFGEIYATHVSPSMLNVRLQQNGADMIINNEFDCDSVSSLFYCRPTQKGSHLRRLYEIWLHNVYLAELFLFMFIIRQRNAIDILASVFFLYPAKAPVRGFYANSKVVIDRMLLKCQIKTCNLDIIEADTPVLNKRHLWVMKDVHSAIIHRLSHDLLFST